MKKIKEILIAFAVLICIGFTSWTLYTAPKIGYVDSYKLVSGYVGMEEASKRYEKKVAEWQLSIDSLQRTLQLEIENYKNDSLLYTDKEKIGKKEYIRRLHYDLNNLNQNFEEKALQEDEKMTEAVWRQVNTYIKEYGERKGYSLILSSQESGSFLYAREVTDITDEILQGLNKHYRNE